MPELALSRSRLRQLKDYADQAKQAWAKGTELIRKELCELRVNKPPDRVLSAEAEQSLSYFGRLLRDSCLELFPFDPDLEAQRWHYFAIHCKVVTAKTPKQKLLIPPVRRVKSNPTSAVGGAPKLSGECTTDSTRSDPRSESADSKADCPSWSERFESKELWWNAQYSVGQRFRDILGDLIRCYYPERLQRPPRDDYKSNDYDDDVVVRTEKHSRRGDAYFDGLIRRLEDELGRNVPQILRRLKVSVENRSIYVDGDPITDSHGRPIPEHRVRILHKLLVSEGSAVRGKDIHALRGCRGKSLPREKKALNQILEPYLHGEAILTDHSGYRLNLHL